MRVPSSSNHRLAQIAQLPTSKCEGRGSAASYYRIISAFLKNIRIEWDWQSSSVRFIRSNTLDGIRTHNLRLRRATHYPLRHQRNLLGKVHSNADTFAVKGRFTEGED